MVAIKINKATFIECGTAISMPADTDFQAEDLAFHRCRTAIALSEPHSLMGALGLPEHTNPELLKEALALLLEHKDAAPAEVTKAIRSSRLADFLATTSDGLGVMERLLSLHGNPLVQAMYQLLTKISGG